MTPGVAQVLAFWFDDLTPGDWWQPGAQLDALVRRRFGRLNASAAAGELHGWRATAAGRLAEIIVLDQFSRQIYRHQARAFSQDGMALALAQEAVATGADRELEPSRRAFLYLPFMHSESALIHRQALELFSQPGLEDNLEHEKRHKAVIDRFGRYPHRNAVLRRASTSEERVFLRQPGSSF